ncbi:MAG: hypothetical protein IT326_02330 [Anaerolineae bacterium]|nr:hypothetical protein [Anaerolineae bacterium]
MSHRKTWLAISLLVVAALTLAACAPAAAPAGDASAEIAGLQNQLATAQAAAAAGGEAVDTTELENQLATAQAEAAAAAEQAQAAQSQACGYNTYRLGWVMDYPDPVNIVNDVFAPTSDFQYTFWGKTYPDQAATFEELVNAAKSDPNVDTRLANYQAAEDILIDELSVVIPIFNRDRTGLRQTYVEGYYPAFGAARFANWDLTNGSDTLRYPVGAVVSTFDPNACTDTTCSAVLYQVLDAPFQYTEDGGLAPLAAESFEVSDDGLVYTIKLREGALWSDGEPVVAQHFVDGIKRLLSPDLANDYAFVMFPIDGAQAYNAGEQADLPSVVAVDDLTLQITLSAPASFFESLLAFSTFHPIRLDVIEANPDSWTAAENFVGNGAYTFVEADPNAGIKLAKSETYWDAANVSIANVEMDVLLEPATTLAAFDAGEIDATTGGSIPSADTVARYTANDPNFIRVAQPGIEYIGLNTSAEHTNDVNFRKALASATDRRTILDGPAGTPWRVETTSLIPLGIAGYREPAEAPGYPYDPEAAVAFLNEYMASAGITDASEIVVEVWFNSNGTNPQVYAAVTDMWETTLGIDARTVGVEFATYLDVLEQCNVLGGGGF